MFAPKLESAGFTESEQNTGVFGPDKRNLYLKCADDLLEYRFLVTENLTSFSEYKFFFPFRASVERLKLCRSTLASFDAIANVERFPNLRQLHNELPKPFNQFDKIRGSRNSSEFRRWIFEASEKGGDEDIIYSYIQSIKSKPNRFEKRRWRYLKEVAVSSLCAAISHYTGDTLFASIVTDLGVNALEGDLVERALAQYKPHIFFDDLDKLRRGGA